MVLLPLGSKASSQGDNQVFLWRRSWRWDYGQDCFGPIWR